MSKKSTVPIIFSSGSYGTYLEWCLTTLTTDVDVNSPLTANGNSHNFHGNHLFGIDGWRQYLASSTYHSFVRFHPKIYQTDDVYKNLNEISSAVDFFVYLYPSQHTLLLALNNQFTKMWKDWWKYLFYNYKIDVGKIYSNWPVDPLTPIDQIPNWVKREFLSYYLMPMYFDQVAWDYPEHHNQHNCMFVSIDNLLYDFKNIIFKIVDRSGVNLVKPIDTLDSHHYQMLSRQKNINQDALCKQIIDSIIDQKMFDWLDQSLPLVSESYIQWQLRKLGFEIRCDGLDTFPTNSVQLKELLYTV